MIIFKIIKALVLWAVLDVIHVQDLIDRLKKI